MPLDVSYGELIVIDGIDVNENIVQAGQHAIAYATTPGAPGGAALTGISAETFYFSENVDVSKNVGLRGNLDVSGTAYVHNVLDVSKNALFRSNVGIGTENPTDKLEVVGDICCTTLKFDSSANQTNIITYNRNPLSSRPSTGNYTGERFSLTTEKLGSYMKFYSNTLSNSTDDNDSSIRFDGALGNAHFKGKVAIGTFLPSIPLPTHHLQIDATGDSTGLLISDITNSNNNVSLIFSSGTGNSGGFGSEVGMVGGMCLNYNCRIGTSSSQGPKGGLIFQKCGYTGGNPENLMVITASGELGIGTLYPTTPLEIITTKATNSGGLLINNTSSGTDEHAKLTLKVASSSGIAHPYISFQTGAGTSGAWSCGIDNSDIQKFKISQSGNELHTNTKLTITIDGNVGIGTTSPGAQLSIKGPHHADSGGSEHTYFAAGMRQNSTASTQGIWGALAIGWQGAQATDDINGTSGNYAANRHIFQTCGSMTEIQFRQGSDTDYNNMYSSQTFKEWLMLSEDGNVGIGTTNPSAKLHIQGTATAETYFTGSGAAQSGNYRELTISTSASSASGGSFHNAKHTFNINSSVGEFDFKTSNGSMMFLQHDGNVGIGTSAPSKKLEVVGDISGGSELFIGGGGGKIMVATTTVTNDTLRFYPGGGYNQNTTFSNNNILQFCTTPNGAGNSITLQIELNATHTTSPSTFTTGPLLSSMVLSNTPSTRDIEFANGVGVRGGLNVNGNVGIGTTNPGSYKLNVDGTALITGNVTCQGTITSTFSGNVTGNVTGNADTATRLLNARTIGGVSFNGTSNINLPGVNTTGNQSTTGTAEYANRIAVFTGRAGTNSTHYIPFVTSFSNGTQQYIYNDSNLTYNPSSNRITASSLQGTGDILAGTSSGGHAPIYAGGWSTPVNAGSIVFRTTNYNTAKNRSNTFTIQSPTGTSGAYTQFEFVGDGLQIVSPNFWNYGCFRPRANATPANNDSANMASVIAIEETNAAITFDAYSSNNSHRGILKTLNHNVYLGGKSAFMINFNLQNCVIWGGNAVSSDDRIKYNEKDISNALITVNKLKPKFYIKESTLTDLCFNRFDASFNFTENDLSNGLPFNTRYESGYIAQDISNDIPELKHIVADPNDPNDISVNNPLLSVDYIGIQPYITKAVQELHQIVQTQETTIGSLQTLISTLQTQNTALEARIAALES
jgi:hypothetical protein